jgi:hypothetical protein
MRGILADIVRLIHYALFFVVAAGPFLPMKYIPYYLVFVWLIFLDWNDFDGVCSLTRVEHYLRTGEWSSVSPMEGGPEFFRPIANRLGFDLTRTEADRLNNFIFLMFWGAALMRFIWFR